MIGELAALGAAVCWTISAILYKEALFNTKPVPANVVRCTFASVFLIVFLLVAGKISVLACLSVYTLVLACVSGIVGFVLGDTLYMVSLKLIGVARAVPLTCTYPLFNILWAVFLKGERVTWQIVLGAVAIVVGIWLLSWRGGANTDENYRNGLVKGSVLALTVAFVWSVSITMVDLAIASESGGLDVAFGINALRVSVAAVFLLISVTVLDRGMDFLRMDKKAAINIVSGGLVALALGWFFLTFSFSAGTPESRAVPISSTSPLFSAIAGMFLLHERVTVKIAAGSLVIVFGVFLIFMV